MLQILPARRLLHRGRVIRALQTGAGGGGSQGKAASTGNSSVWPVDDVQSCCGEVNTKLPKSAKVTQMFGWLAFPEWRPVVPQKKSKTKLSHAIKDFLISKESYNGVSGRKKALKWILSVFQNYLSFFHSTPLVCNPNSFMDASPTKHPDSPHSCTPKPCPTPTHVYQKSAYQK